MAQANHSDHLEDNRFQEVSSLRKKDVPHQLHWFLKEDYFSNELLGFLPAEIDRIRQLTEEAFSIFVKATDKILEDRQLHTLGIPKTFEPVIYHSWKNRTKHPFLAGRFDVNGGVGQLATAVIEFNADTCSTLPETLFWQPLQFQQLKGSYQQFNNLREDLLATLTQLQKASSPNPVFLGSSFGYPEDVANVNCILDIAFNAGFQTFYQDLEHVTFSEEGIFYQEGEEYVKVDVWYKMIPWDWMFNEEPDLAAILSKIVIEDLAVVLNPAYTSLWQNKLFLAYITKHFPNNVIAETHTEPTWGLTSYAQKPVYGRLGENILVKDENGKESRTKGDYGKQPSVYQRFFPLAQDDEKYYYQLGMFYTRKPSALNLRAQETNILTDDCEFMSHYITNSLETSYRR
jgi:glutathionylspermidine synthase